MTLTPIKKGSRGPLVRKWQNFLLGRQYYKGPVDGIFGDGTASATKKYQANAFLEPVDGIVGNQTWGSAMADGLVVVEPATGDKEGPGWPPRPTDLKPATWRTRIKLFGEVPFTAAPTKNNPERIVIPAKWQQENITQMVLPTLKGMMIEGLPASCRISWNRKVRDQILGLFEEIEHENLTVTIHQWAGSWAPRFVRGSRTTLSNHSWGTAFDINVHGNYLGQRPALVGSGNSVRELVPIAAKWGFWWGGWGWPPKYDRLDGMHFEVAKILTPSEIQANYDRFQKG